MSLVADEWNADDTPTAWVSADERDNDFSRFFVYLREALLRLPIFDWQPDPGVPSGSETAFSGMRAEAFELIDRIAGTPHPFALFVDGFEKIHSPEVIRLIDELARSLNPGQRLIIGARTVKALSITALEIAGQVLRIDADALAANTADFLLLCGRILLAWIFINSGYGKLFVGGIEAYSKTFPGRGLPPMLAYIAVPAEFFGGVLLLLGLATRYVVGVIMTLITAMVILGELGISIAPLLARVRDQLTTVQHIIVKGPGDASSLGADLLDYDELLAGEPGGFEYPEVTESTGAAMCYTSGTTGNPKGVMYSHRSTYMHSLLVTSTANIALSETDRMLVIVPMFHANAWGMPYAAWIDRKSVV